MDRSDDRITIVRAVQTCRACPSQWDAWDDQGRYYYLRYRSGLGSVERFSDAEWHLRDDEPEVIVEFEHGHPLDGCISLIDFAELAGLKLAVSRDNVSATPDVPTED